MTESSRLPQLVEASGRNAGRIHDLPWGEHVLGRGGDASIQLDHPDVSRRHARLEVRPERVIVHDLGSKNGVLAGGDRVQGSRVLLHGESIQFGDLVLTLSHPSSQVSRALHRAGESVTTTTRTNQAVRSGARALVLPLVGVAVFGTLVAVLLLG